MSTSRLPKRRLIAASLAVVVVIAGVLVAVLSGGGRGKLGSSPAATFARAGTSQVSVAASQLGVAPSTLRRELRAGHSLAEVAKRTGHSPSKLVESLVAANAPAITGSSQLTPAQRRERLAALRARMTAAVNRRGRRPAIGVVNIAAAARYLGLRPAAVRHQLTHGRTLAQIAEATPGRSAAGVLAALLAVRTAALHRATAAGTITPKAEAALLATLQRRLTLLVHGQPPR
jgi:hypothetical protein